MRMAIIRLVRPSLLIFLLFNSILFYGQNKIGNLELPPDTSDYLPAEITGAASYNLMIAASKGYLTEIEKLIKRGADVSVETAEGATALIFAVVNNHPLAVRLLIALGADVDKMTRDSETPLIIAVRGGNLEIAEILLRAGADIDLPGKYDATPLHYASINGDFYLVDLLLYYEAAIDPKDSEGTTPLMAAIWGGHADITDLLMQNGANLEARDEEGYTPLLIAAQNGDTLIMDMLLKQGTDLYEKTRGNYDAVDLAVSSDKPDAVRFLLDKGDQWYSKEKQIINPYQVAVAYGKKDAFNLLAGRNVPGKPGPQINSIGIGVGVKVNPRDFYTTFSLEFREPLLGAGLIAGVDAKLWPTRILMKGDENLYYQYLDKSTNLFAGVFKDLTVSGRKGGSGLFLSLSLQAAYTLGNRFRGTGSGPEEKLTIVPAAIFRLRMNHISLHAGAEYMKSQFYGISPVWLRTGISYNLFLNRGRIHLKTIRWN